MSQLIIELPSDVSEDEAKLFLSMKLFETAKLSLGQAAEMAGFSKRAYMEILAKHGISVFNYQADELSREQIV